MGLIKNFKLAFSTTGLEAREKQLVSSIQIYEGTLERIKGETITATSEHARIISEQQMAVSAGNTELATIATNRAKLVEQIEAESINNHASEREQRQLETEQETEKLRKLREQILSCENLIDMKDTFALVSSQHIYFIEAWGIYGKRDILNKKVYNHPERCDYVELTEGKTDITIHGEEFVSRDIFHYLPAAYFNAEYVPRKVLLDAWLLANNFDVEKGNEAHEQYLGV